MKNAIIECLVKNKETNEVEKIVFDTDYHMEEFLLYNDNYEMIEARKIVELQSYNNLTKEFEWI